MRETEVLAAAGIDPRSRWRSSASPRCASASKRVPLIKSASVRKLYPNELVDRPRPSASLMRSGSTTASCSSSPPTAPSSTGCRTSASPTCRFVVGEQANARTKEYLALLDAAGPLKPRIRAGTLVSGRRWTLKMDNGIDVRLPELGAAEAVARLVKLDREQKILDKDVLAVDLRMRRPHRRPADRRGRRRPRRSDEEEAHPRQGGRHMSLSRHGLTPRSEAAVRAQERDLSVLDIGTSKVVCLVAQLQPAGTAEALRGRTHLARIIGIGHQRSLGLKGGAVVDLRPPSARSVRRSMRPSGWPRSRSSR